jgi:adenosylhomocysteine nucleosidase
LVSSGQEWRAVREFYPEVQPEGSPYGEWFPYNLGGKDLVFFHGGDGKIAAAASAQYALDRWQPRLIVNLGTCGGFAGDVQRGEILLVERSIVYDIVEQIGDQQAAYDRFTTHLDLSWLSEPYPQPVRRGLLASGDRDILPADITWLRERFGAVAADWETGAIAWVAARNAVRCLVLRGVSDLVGADGGEAYGNLEFYAAGARQVMSNLLAYLPEWLEIVNKK